MSRRKRPWGVIAGPILFFGGLAVFLGVQKAGSIKDLVEHWGHELEHSSEPVVMDLPVYVPLFVGGDWLGRLETVVVQRDRPGTVDGVRLIAHIDDKEHLASLENCALRLQVRDDNIGELKRALRCVKDTENLVSFGDLRVRNADMTVPVVVRLEDLPCDEMGRHVGPCQQFQHQLQVQMRGLADELSVSVRELQREARRIQQRVQVEVREKVREAGRRGIR
jgi:hypothetical protein